MLAITIRYAKTQIFPLNHLESLYHFYAVCRKCIYEKITEDEIECCPVCDIDLGGAPLEKLRPDHILQDLKAKIFTPKRKRERAPEVVSSITLPARRKERSISSLVVSTPRVSAQTGTTGKRTKSLMRKDVRGSGSFTKRTVKKEEEFGDDHTESGSSPETLKDFTQSKRQSSYAEPSQSLSNRRNKDGAEPWDSKLNLWKPLNFLVDVANGTKSEHGNASHADVQGNKTKTKDYKRRSLSFYMSLESSGSFCLFLAAFELECLPCLAQSVYGTATIRKCIYEKITEDEIECCPVCDIDLGGAPLEKLRPDHILQDLKAKIFTPKRKRERAPEVVSSITLPARRKERSISSLVVSTPRVSAQTGTTGKRTKSLMRKDVRGSGSFTKRTVKKEEEFGDDHTESGSSPETLKDFTQSKRQ
ncbi:hypothetical protein DY000_02030075, partial [Brassica cretica]